MMKNSMGYDIISKLQLVGFTSFPAGIIRVRLPTKLMFRSLTAERLDNPTIRI